MLPNWKNVPRAISMQICAAITEKFILKNKNIFFLIYYKIDLILILI